MEAIDARWALISDGQVELQEGIGERVFPLRDEVCEICETVRSRLEGTST